LTLPDAEAKERIAKRQCRMIESGGQAGLHGVWLGQLSLVW